MSEDLFTRRKNEGRTNTVIPYIIAGLASLLAMLIMYTLFVPKNSQSTSNTNEESANPLLKAISVIGNDLYKSLPAGFVKSTQGEKKQFPRIESLIVRSGNPWNLKAQEFVTTQYVAAVLGFLASWVIFFAVNTAVSVPWWIIVPLTTIFAFMIPKIKYKEQAKSRDLEFKRQLPEALDLLIISLSSGRTFSHALREIIPNMQDSVLKEEFRNIVKNLDSGYTLKESLDDFATRAPNEGIETFVRSVQSATEVNAPLVETLESRAEASRQEFFDIIHQKTAQLESKIFLILTPLIMPAVMLIAIAPSVSSMLETLGG